MSMCYRGSDRPSLILTVETMQENSHKEAEVLLFTTSDATSLFEAIALILFSCITQATKSQHTY